MSDLVYIPCATARSVQNTCVAARVQSLVAIEFDGVKADFIPADAARIGRALIEFAERAGWRNPEADDGR